MVLSSCQLSGRRYKLEGVKNRPGPDCTTITGRGLRAGRKREKKKRLKNRQKRTSLTENED